ncbi:unnamed protein product [Cylindrotheca closterium]|uniref:Choline transporter-like protein n=1 Tax=Cylindrotheca closterium TaxID=2856 RepID=A0AAD2CHY8_9STRA|nr:unnamed protein product [Cylindrotheca closterium]
MSSPVMVAGDHISPQQQASQSERKPGCKDPIFAVLLYVNVAAIIGIAATMGKDALTSASDGGSIYDYSGFIYAGVVISLVSLVFAGFALLIVMKFPETVIKISLIFVTILAGIWAVMAFLSGSIIGGVVGLLFFGISVWYAKAVWSRIPFAACNLSTAITAIRQNFGVVLFAYLFPILGVFWVIVWLVAFLGIYDSIYSTGSADGSSSSGVAYGYLFLMFLSMFFTEQVLENCVQCTISGVVGTWWIAPQDNGFCSGAVCGSFIRTVTTSFGSICFGSLLVAIIRALESLARSARENGDAGILACIAECLLGCLAGLVEYFNKWAFVYVGVYGYGYLEAGKNVIQLFKNRGWEAIIADDLVGNVVGLMSFVTGGFMGGIAVLLESNTEWFSSVPSDAPIFAFILGFILGTAITAILLSTMASGVNAVIVMFADAPAELERNYPEISMKMREKWNEVYPGSV